MHKSEISEYATEKNEITSQPANDCNLLTTEHCENCLTDPRFFGHFLDESIIYSRFHYYKKGEHQQLEIVHILNFR